MQAADDSMMQTLEREYGPLGDYQEAVVQQEGARRAAWLPTDGAAGAAAGDATTTRCGSRRSPRLTTPGGPRSHG